LTFYIKKRSQKIILNQERRKSSNYGHDEEEWGFEEGSENKEWEEYYESKSRKWRTEEHDG